MKVDILSQSLYQMCFKGHSEKDVCVKLGDNIFHVSDIQIPKEGGRIILTLNQKVGEVAPPEMPSTVESPVIKPLTNPMAIRKPLRKT